MTNANCFVVLPMDCGRVDAGALVDVQPFFWYRLTEDATWLESRLRIRTNAYSSIAIPSNDTSQPSASTALRSGVPFIKIGLVVFM